jgi:hypothetical protein
MERNFGSDNVNPNDHKSFFYRAIFLSWFIPIVLHSAFTPTLSASAYRFAYRLAEMGVAISSRS